MEHQRPIPFAQFAVLLGATLLFLGGCARETAIFEDAIPEAVLPISTDGRTLLPENFYDQSVGRALVDVQADPDIANTKAFRFLVQGGSNTVGGFNGSGTGSRALLALGSWSGKPLGAVTDLRWEFKSTFGALAVGILLQVDLNCAPGSSDIAVLEAPASLLNPPTPTADGYLEYQAPLSDAIWVSAKDPIIDPTTSAEVISNQMSSPGKLTELLGVYPSACLKNGSTGADSLPLNIPTAAILWSLGSDDNTSAASGLIRRLQIGPQVYKDLL